MEKELSPEEIRKIKISKLRRLQMKYHQMEKEKRNKTVHERASIGVHMMELQMRADRLENGGI
ncbi:MAG: hypothetical protein J6S67_11000 [Methanobrevibacter sp.]|nr:hypothetical protein [Methanobrevibacter sp.]